jgi:hypothetical protein
LAGNGGIRMRARTPGLVAGCVAAGSLALMAGGLILAYVDRHLVPASLTYWDFSDVFGDVVNMAVPVGGFARGAGGPPRGSWAPSSR